MNDVESLEKPNLIHSLCRFIPEVTKKKGKGLYPGRTLYQMIKAIEKYLFVNKIKWNLTEDSDFEEVQNVLDNVMQERAQANVGVVPKRAEIISYEDEEKLWKEGLLGEDTPDKLRNTLLFLFGINMLFSSSGRSL